MSPALWILFFAAIGGLAWVLVFVVQRVVNVSGWEAVDATVLTSGIRQVSGPLARQDSIPGRDRSFRVEIEYAYRYGGEEHAGDTVFRGSPGAVFPSEARAERLQKDYPVGAVVTAYVNPARPSESVLVTARAVQPGAWVALFVFACVVLSIFGLILLTQLGYFHPLDFLKALFNKE